MLAGESIPQDMTMLEMDPSFLVPKKAEMAKIAAKKKKLPPKNVNFRPNANRNRHMMKLSDMFDHGHESGGRRPEGYNYDTGHDKGYNEEYIS